MSPQTHVRLDPLSGAFLGNRAFAGVINEDEVLTELEVVGVGAKIGDWGPDVSDDLIFSI